MTADLDGKLVIDSQAGLTESSSEPLRQQYDAGDVALAIQTHSRAMDRPILLNSCGTEPDPERRAEVMTLAGAWTLQRRDRSALADGLVLSL